MKTMSLMLIASLSCATAAAAQSRSNVLPPANQPTNAAVTSTSRSCLAVKDVGSHALRNIVLAGVAGALISKKQYQVVDVVDYPASPGQKFHGGDLQTLQTGGTKIVILGKNYSAEDLHRACR